MDAMQITTLLNHIQDRIKQPVELVETHISWVLLTGNYAYKIKKPVNYGFLDFTSLPKRKHFCEEELRLNQRFSHDLYLGVIPVLLQKGQIKLQDENIGHTETLNTNSGAINNLSGDEIIDYAVKMHQFDRTQELDKVHENHPLDRTCCEALGTTLAQSHKTLQSAAPEAPFGQPDSVQAPVKDNFVHLNQCIRNDDYQKQIDLIQKWTKTQNAQLQSTMHKRKQESFIKECHGDLHLGNITRINDKITFFDCIEFNESFRWIDTMSELAFLLMDLESKNGHKQANWVLNKYLEVSGDYAGLTLLTYYKVYRALVRAKVSELTWQSVKAAQTTEAAKDHYLKDFKHYIDLAHRYIQPRQPMLILMHGISGSGKSTVAKQITDTVGAIHLRSDIERKRLFGLQPTEASHEKQPNLYHQTVSDEIFNHLLSITTTIINSKWPVIVDATFILQHRRAPFLKWAKQHKVLSIIVHCDVPLAQADQWITARARTGQDPSEATIAIAENQLKQIEPASETECDRLFRLDPSNDSNVNNLLQVIAKISMNDHTADAPFAYELHTKPNSEPHSKSKHLELPE